MELEGKELGCWCKPYLCHGDILIKLFKERQGMNSWLKGSDDRQTTPVLNQDGQHGKSSDDSRNESVFANTYDSEDRQVNELTNPSPHKGTCSFMLTFS